MSLVLPFKVYEKNIYDKPKWTLIATFAEHEHASNFALDELEKRGEGYSFQVREQRDILNEFGYAR